MSSRELTRDISGTVVLPYSFLSGIEETWQVRALFILYCVAVIPALTIALEVHFTYGQTILRSTDDSQCKKQLTELEN